MSSHQEELSSSSSSLADPKQTSTSNIETIKTDSDSESKASSDINSTPKKKRRRAENERLMEDLSNIDKSMSETTIESSPTSRLRTRNKTRPSEITSTSLSSPTIKSNKPKKETEDEDLIKRQLKEKEKLKEEMKQKKRIDNIRQRLQKAVKKNEDFAAESTFLSPNNMSANKLYSRNYAALKIIDFKPIRFVQLTKDADNKKMHYKCPLLEIICKDFNDRFGLEYTRGVFDDPSIKEASSAIIKVYLLGTYALKSKDFINKDLILHIKRVWTCHNENDFFRIIQKRKTITTSSETEQNINNSEEYPFSIIVHFDEDLELNFENSSDSTKDDDNLDEEELVQYDPFVDIYQHSLKTITEIKIDDDSDDDIDFGKFIVLNLPEISFNSNWLKPRDFHALNRELHIGQQSIAKFEYTSKTIKA